MTPAVAGLVVHTFVPANERMPNMNLHSYLMSKFLRRGRKTQQARRKPYRPRLERLEDRTVPSITSTITLINNSGFTLTAAGENFDNDAHDLTTRPNTIPNGTTAV